MTRLRMGIPVTILLAFMVGNVQSAPNPDPQAEVIERLAPAMATGDPVRLVMAFRAMGNYGLPAADIVESSVNAMGYRRLEKSDVAAAIAIFELNKENFPLSANAWDSLAEAVMASGDRETAIRYYRRSLDLDPANKNASLMIERIVGEQQFSYASDSES